MILSASRRTDIPAYYSEWFINRLQVGYVLARNPMNHTQVSKITLSPDTIDCIVFWTKDPANILDKLPLLDEMGFKYYFQFTITPYGKEIESNLRDKSEIIKTFIQLSKIIGKDKVLWRYDPIILNDSLTITYHSEMFETLCSMLTNYTNFCTISFVDMYSKLDKALKGKLIREITESEMLQLATIFSETGRKYNLKLRTCSEKIDFSNYGIHPASCIDKSTVEEVCGYKIDSRSDTNQRTGCGCIQSIDIGAYNTCKNGCVYCYANYSDSAVKNNCNKHNPCSDVFIGTAEADEKIIERKMKSLRNDQIKLF
jgi:hypothetical protein